MSKKRKKRRVKRLSGPANEAEPMAKGCDRRLKTPGLLTRNLTNQEIIEVNRSTGAAAWSSKRVGPSAFAIVRTFQQLTSLLGKFFFQD